MRFLRMAAASVATMMVLSAAAVSTSFADPPPASVLEADPTSLSLDANPLAPVAAGDLPHSAKVTVGLDENCQQAIEATNYSIEPGTSSYVSVSPSTSGELSCGQTFEFTVTGVAATPVAPPADDTLLHFSAVAKNAGLQKKVGGTDIVIVVIDTSDNGGLDDLPGDNGRPAAPAIANAYLNLNADVAAACKAAKGGAKNWRGRVISQVADEMPKPQSVKDDLTLYPEDSDWVNFVTSTLVDPQCNYNQ